MAWKIKSKRGRPKKNQKGRNDLMANLADVLDATKKLDVAVDDLIKSIGSGVPSVDLQPAVDAINAITSKVAAATPPATLPPTPV